MKKFERTLVLDLEYFVLLLINIYLVSMNLFLVVCRKFLVKKITYEWSTTFAVVYVEWFSFHPNMFLSVKWVQHSSTNQCIFIVHSIRCYPFYFNIYHFEKILLKQNRFSTVFIFCMKIIIQTLKFIYRRQLSWRLRVLMIREWLLVIMFEQCFRRFIFFSFSRFDTDYQRISSVHLFETQCRISSSDSIVESAVTNGFEQTSSNKRIKEMKSFFVMLTPFFCYSKNKNKKHCWKSGKKFSQNRILFRNSLRIQ